MSFDSVSSDFHVANAFILEFIIEDSSHVAMHDPKTEDMTNAQLSTLSLARSATPVAA